MHFFEKGREVGESLLAYELRKVDTQAALTVLSKHTATFPVTTSCTDVPMQTIDMDEGLHWSVIHAYKNHSGKWCDHGIPEVFNDICLVLTLLEQLNGELALSYMDRILIYQGGLNVLAINNLPQSTEEGSKSLGTGRCVAVDIRRLGYLLADTRARNTTEWNLKAYCALCIAAVVWMVWDTKKK